MNHKIIYGNCESILPIFKQDSVDLIFTSPPYAGKRGKQYDTISADEYVHWFSGISIMLQKVLKPTGTFILNIKEGTDKGERQGYVMDLVQTLKIQKWIHTETYIWHKSNAMCGKWPNRFRDSFEYLFHFTLNKKFYMNQKAVMKPIGEWVKKEGKRKPGMYKPKSGSVFCKDSNKINKLKMVYPSNVITMPTQSYNVGHPAAYPLALPEWFIKLFTKQHDVVLDPFVGSGSTCIAAKKLHRKCVGIENKEDYYNVAKRRMESIL